VTITNDHEIVRCKRFFDLKTPELEYISDKSTSSDNFWCTTSKQETQLMLTYPRDAFRGQSRSLHITIPYVSYSFLLCNSNFVFKTFFRYSTSKNVVTLKYGSEFTQGHWKWCHSIDWVWFPISVLLLFYRNFVHKTKIFDCYLDNWVTGPSMSLEMSPLARAHMTSYWHSIVTMALSLVASEIFNVEECRDLEIGFRGHWKWYH